ncbi:hypothetical protein Tco_0500261 [Tanacetum coccineum]
MVDKMVENWETHEVMGSMSVQLYKRRLQSKRLNYEIRSMLMVNMDTHDTQHSDRARRTGSACMQDGENQSSLDY